MRGLVEEQRDGGAEALWFPLETAQHPRVFSYLLLNVYQFAPTLCKLRKYLCIHGQIYLSYIKLTEFIFWICLMFHTPKLVHIYIVLKVVVCFNVLNVMKCSMFCPDRFH